MPSPSEVYKKHEPLRSPYEYRAEKCAALSIPYLFPRMGNTSGESFPTPFQSNAANGVNTMTSAMSLALLPPNMPHFRLELMGKLETELRLVQSEYEAAGRPERIMEEVQAGLGLWERAVVKEVERHNYRIGCHESLRLEIVTGNSLIEHLDEGGLRVHGLRSYVVARNPDDSPQDIVLHELKGRDQLTEEEIEAVSRVDWAWANLGRDDKVSIYTRICFKQDRYEMVQQVGSSVMEDDAVEGKAVDCPFWPQRFIRVSGEPYGRSYMEEYFGDVGSLDTTQQSLVEAAALMAKVLFMIDPASGISPKVLSTAPNGAFRSGNADFIKTLQVGKQADMSVAFSLWEKLSNQVNRAFAVPEVRNAERVTAEEVRWLAQQLERSLGGTFPLKATDFQMPLTHQVIRRLQKKNVLPKLPQGGVEPVIVTGIQALGRSTDDEVLTQLVAEAGAVFGPQAVLERIDIGAWLTRKATAKGLDPSGLIRSDEQLAAMQQAAQQAAMQAKVAEQIVPAAGKVIAKAVPEGAGGVPQAA